MRLRTIDPPAVAHDDQAFESECVRFFTSVATALGVPRSLGQIYGLLYASPDPLTFSDIVARLEISKGSVSQGLALLRELGAVNEAPSAAVSGSNGAGNTRGVRVSFLPELSLRRLVSGILRERIAPLATEGAESLERLRILANGGDPVVRAHRFTQARRLAAWRRRLKSVLPALTILLGPKKRDQKNN